MSRPDMELLIHGRLAPAESLVNVATITGDRAPGEVNYFQIELEDHDCIIAEGAWAETFADGQGLRQAFQNAAEFTGLYPDHDTPETARLCAPRLETGPEFDAMPRPMLARAAASVAAGPLRGWIEAVIAESRVEGWAQDVDHPEAPVAPDVWLDDEKIGSVLACERRWDLVEAKIGRGHQAFYFSSPVPLPPEKLAAPRVRRASDGANLEILPACAEAARAIIATA